MFNKTRVPNLKPPTPGRKLLWFIIMLFKSIFLMIGQLTIGMIVVKTEFMPVPRRILRILTTAALIVTWFTKVEVHEISVFWILFVLIDIFVFFRAIYFTVEHFDKVVQEGMNYARSRFDNLRKAREDYLKQREEEIAEERRRQREETEEQAKYDSDEDVGTQSAPSGHNRFASMTRDEASEYYKMLMKKYHPDNAKTGDEDKAKSIAAEYEEFLDVYARD